MTDFLLDSSFLIPFLNEVEGGVSGPARGFRAKIPRRTRLFVSIVSIAELLEGARDPMAVESDVMRLAEPLGLSRQHARRAGLMQRRAKESGSRMGENDAWIAATAAIAGLKIVGDDDKAFANRASVNYVNFRESVAS